MTLLFAIIFGAGSVFTAVLAGISEIMFFSVMWLIVSFILGCISIAKFHETSQEYGGSIFYVIAQIFIILFFIVVTLDIFNLAGY